MKMTIVAALALFSASGAPGHAGAPKKNAPPRYAQTAYFQKGLATVSIGGAETLMGGAYLTRVGDKAYVLLFPNKDVELSLFSYQYGWISNQLTMNIGVSKIVGPGLKTGDTKGMAQASGKCVVQTSAGLKTIDKVSCAVETGLGTASIDFDGNGDPAVETDGP